MLNHPRYRPASIFALITLLSPTLQAQDAPPAKTTAQTLLSQPTIDFATRRSELMKRLRDASPSPCVAALKGWEISREDYEEGKARQANNVAYLTGVETPGTALLLIPHQNKATLYLPPNRGRVGLGAGDPGPGPGPDAAALYGFDHVEPSSRFITDLIVALTADPDRSAALYLIDANSPSRPTGKLAKWLKEGLPALQIRPLEPILGELRKTKTESEVALLQKAIDITGTAFDRVMSSMAPGKFEFQLGGQIMGAFLEEGAERAGFASIVGSGPNGTIPHYFALTRQMKADELVVVDIGAEYRYYTADVTRTYPVSGKFTPRQRELYQLVLDAQRACEKHIENSEGKATLAEMTAFTSNFLRQSPLRAKDRNGQDQTMDRFFIHGLGHYLGMEVHDVGDTQKPFAPGEVFTIEPGLYIESENTGIRIEDDYLTTENGLLKLTKNIASDPDEIERQIAAAKARAEAAVPKP
jgi:Xaa-Pro aminopeptidase